MHADHITGTGKLKHLRPGVLSVLAEASGGQADVKVTPGEIIKVGNLEVEVRATPGHTNGTFALHAIDWKVDSVLATAYIRTYPKDNLICL